MAKKRSGVNVSEAIRAYLKENTGAGPTAAAKAISEQIGQTVAPSYVSNIKSTMEGGKAPVGRRGRKPAAAASSPVPAKPAAAHAKNGTLQLSTIEAMKGILQEVSPDTAKRLIDLLA